MEKSRSNMHARVYTHLSNTPTQALDGRWFSRPPTDAHGPPKSGKAPHPLSWGGWPSSLAKSPRTLSSYSNITDVLSDFHPPGRTNGCDACVEECH